MTNRNDKWTAIGIAYGDAYKIGSYRTQQEAIDAVGIEFDSRCSVRRCGGCLEIDGRHLVVKTSDLVIHGYDF